MKALSVTQPWATLIAISAKTIETRSWKTAHRGPLAIHAARSFPKEARKFTTLPECYEAVKTHHSEPAYPLGVVLATCVLTDCVETDIWSFGADRFDEIPAPPSAMELKFGDFSPGRWAWILRDVKLLPKPVSAMGWRGLWDWNPGGTQ